MVEEIENMISNEKKGIKWSKKWNEKLKKPWKI